MNNGDKYDNSDRDEWCRGCDVTGIELYWHDEAYYCPDCQDTHGGYLCKECYGKKEDAYKELEKVMGKFKEALESKFNKSFKVSFKKNRR